jgi:hypothetical protein
MPLNFNQRAIGGISVLKDIALVSVQELPVLHLKEHY